ncbi:hypothetical protein B0T25DRAFT_599698 [Lasiosphaeria hispida]|uniref:Uncharacterized protein n=1 Tax=Lasiosphaeria hispida TaxID=260671 RepID=A0AAJ0MH19_9PEZI|nr:hypothetical protein B0T25DRAFT_599698 [Lasiosphaeria hispida]
MAEHRLLNFYINGSENYDLDKYIKEKVPEPPAGDERDAWDKERNLVGYILGATLIEPEISGVLRRFGWNLREPNLKVTYDLVKEIFGFQPERAGFATMGLYTGRIQTLRRELEKTNWMFDDNTIMGFALIGLEHLYLVKYKRWVVASLDGGDELNRTDLLKELTRIGEEEKSR